MTAAIKKSKTADVLTKYGMGEASKEIFNRLIVSYSAREKCGKTTFGLSTPSPMVYYNSDFGDEGVIQKAIAEGKKIYPYPIEIPEGKTPEENMGLAQPLWTRFTESFEDFLATDSIRSIVVDTETELWELIRLAMLGSTTKVYGKNFAYTPVNAAYRRLWRKCLKYPDKNVILLHKMKAEYVDDKRTGKYERSGFGDIGYIAQLVCTGWKDKVDPTLKPPRTIPVFSCRIDECRPNPMVENTVLSGDMCNFTFLAMTSMPNSDPSAWM